jgi:hypothetical protein
MSIENTKLSLESHGQKYTAELNWDCNCEDLLESFLGLSVAATFPYKTVVETMYFWAKNQLNTYFPNEYNE